MCSLVVFRLVFSYQANRLAWERLRNDLFWFFHTKPIDWLGERLRNDLFCVEWDVKPQLSQSLPSLVQLTQVP